MQTLLEDLKSIDPKVRNSAAISLMDFLEEAKLTLLEQTQRNENQDFRGTLVYALNQILCTDSFLPLFRVFLDSGFEVAMHVHNIFANQHFELTEEEKIEAKCLYKDFSQRVALSEYDFEEERQKRLEEVIHWYVENE